MREFDLLCKEFEEMDSETYAALLLEKSATLVPALSLISANGLSGIAIFSTFIFGAIAADGRLSEEEYTLVYPLLHAFFGDKIDYESCKKAVKSMRAESKDLKDTANEMVDVLGELSEDLKDDIILVCLMICSIDGKISLKEKQWIKKLIK